MNRTPLYAIHEQFGAKFGPFAGFDMPLFYESGIIKEHLHTRANAGFFDISHMMLVQVSGNDASALISRLTPLNAQQMNCGDARYTFLLNERAGIIDDLIVSKISQDRYLIVCNAGCADKDWAHIESHSREFNASAKKLPLALVALQGPKAVSVLLEMGIAVNKLGFMQIMEHQSGTDTWLVSRCGYTGEDGFEIAIPHDQVAEFSQQLLDDKRVLPIGLGARDSLRLEAGLSLYGQDLSEDITPMEAGLIWAIPKNLRNGGAYLGANAVAEKIANGRTRKRVGFVPEGRAPVRAGSKIFDAAGNHVGEVTSGGFGPSVDHPVALGLISADCDTDGLTAQVRKKMIKLQKAALPFTPHNYKR